MLKLSLLLITATAVFACSSRGDAGRTGVGSNCRAGGEFHADLYGALRATLAWQNGELRCEGMPRPFGEGARLRFAGQVAVKDTMQNLAFIVALPDLQPGAVGRELRAKVTIIEEDNGRFFSNAEQEICWADINSQQLLVGSRDSYAVNGIVYCVAPLAAISTAESITIRDLKFGGRVDWQGNTL